MTKTRLTGYDAITDAEDIQPSVLTAEITDDTVRVRDPRGGVWYPDEEAEAEIRAASDPEARAVEIARTEPMRGTWHD